MRKLNDYWLAGEIIPNDIDSALLFNFVSQQRGWVYIAQPSDHPDLVKIGFSKKPLNRMITLRSAGVLGHFTLLHSTLFAHASWAESLVHQQLSKFNVDREFFRVSVDTAKACILDTLKIENTLLQNCLSGLRTCPTKDAWLNTINMNSLEP